MLKQHEVKEICSKFGVDAVNIGEVIDTSRGEGDIRYNYMIDSKYVLKINTAPMVKEEFLQGINRLVERYRDIGVWCPKILASLRGNYIYEFCRGVVSYKCYMEECAPYSTAEQCDEDAYGFKKKMLGHLGKLAAKYTNVDLVEHKSMWSIIDLAPLDTDVDEKQENLNFLCEVLKEYGYGQVAQELTEVNEGLRQTIKQHFAQLPRCVYQGDLNFSNLLVGENGDFAGIIDFNMFGTEVNINCFVNETMYLEEEDFECLDAAGIHRKMRNSQDELLAEIFKYYSLNEAEKACLEAYRKIAELSQYPHVMLWKYFLDRGKYVDKVIELIRIMIGR